MSENMKKVVGLTSAILITAVCLSGCSKKNATVPPVENISTGVLEEFSSMKQFDNEFVQVAYDSDIFDFEERGDEISLTLGVGYSSVNIVSHEAQGFITGISYMMLDPDLKSAELYDILFWEAIAPYYDLNIADVLPTYIVNGMGTSNLDKPVSTCEAIFYVDEFNDLPPLKFDVKFVGAEDGGVLVKVIYETTFDDDAEPLENEEATLLYGLKDSLGIKVSWDQLDNEQVANPTVQTSDLDDDVSIVLEEGESIQVMMLEEDLLSEEVEETED